MVGAMNRLLLPFALGSAISLGAVALGVAAELPDPTRPPAALRPATTTATTAMPSAPTLVLQSVLIGEGRKPSAIINGRVVELGESFEGLKLVRVFDQGALLAGPGGATTLALTPGSEKVAVATTPGAPAQPIVAMTKPSPRRGDVATFIRTGEKK
jgi:hypothetical protein